MEKQNGVSTVDTGRRLSFSYLYMLDPEHGSELVLPYGLCDPRCPSFTLLAESSPGMCSALRVVILGPLTRDCVLAHNFMSVPVPPHSPYVSKPTLNPAAAQ